MKLNVAGSLGTPGALASTAGSHTLHTVRRSGSPAAMILVHFWTKGVLVNSVIYNLMTNFNTM